MELREWLIILGLALVSLIVVDGVRRLQRQRRVPRLDQAVKDLPKATFNELDDAAKEAEISWELPNGGARVVKPADYSSLGKKPKLERQEHPGASKVLSEFKRTFSKTAPQKKSTTDSALNPAEPITSKQSSTFTSPAFNTAKAAFAASTTPFKAASPKPKQSEPTVFELERREPSLSMDAALDGASKATDVPDASNESQPELARAGAKQASNAEVADNVATANMSSDIEQTSPIRVDANEPVSDTSIPDAPASSAPASSVANKVPDQPQETMQEEERDEPVLRAERDDAAFFKPTEDSPKRRQLRSDIAGDHGELNDDEIDEYRLVDFEGIGRSFKRKLIEQRKKREARKAEKAQRTEAQAKLKAERKALEAEQRREAKEAADAERARIAQERAEALEARNNRQYEPHEMAATDTFESHSQRDDVAAYDNTYDSRTYDDDRAYDYEDELWASEPPQTAKDSVVRAHPTLEKALRHDVNGEHAKETLTHADEMVVISVLSRDSEGFDGGKLLELMMACGLRYSRTMGVFHRFETESDDSELQFSMVNVLKPGTFPIEEMDEFVTPGITLLMPLPGAADSSAAFEAMVETAMVLVRHMGGELKDENHSVMTAQTIEFARQRVHEFERRHRLHRHMQAR